MKNSRCPYNNRGQKPYAFGKNRYSPFKKKREAAFNKRQAVKSQEELLKRACSANETAPIGIFLDDERPCPEGWILARTPGEFYNILHMIEHSRLTHLALDWHLGSGQPNGYDIAVELSEPNGHHIRLLDNVKMVYCHSSDYSRAREMIVMLNASMQHVHFVMNTPGAFKEGHI